MDALTILDHPPLRNPVLVTAYYGWNDAANAASAAIRHLRRRFRGSLIATIAAEEFFVFTQKRPEVRLRDGLHREIRWPDMEFHYIHLEDAGRDLILGLGTEPDLKWKTFCAAVLQLARDLGIGELVTLGAMLADTPHTFPVPINGGATDPRRALELRLQPSAYQGPTGIIGAVNEACLMADLSALTIWASVPHYVSGAVNPKATQALLHRLNEVYSLGLDLHDLDVRSRRYESEVTNALRDNPDVQEYVRRLEAQQGGAPAQIEPATSGAELRSEDVLDEIDRLLRRDDAGAP